MTRRREDSPSAPPRCDACGATDVPLEPAIVAGMPVQMCVQPAACRMRAQAKGTWGKR